MLVFCGYLPASIPSTTYSQLQRKASVDVYLYHHPPPPRHVDSARRTGSHATLKYEVANERHTDAEPMLVHRCLLILWAHREVDVAPGR